MSFKAVLNGNFSRMQFRPRKIDTRKGMCVKLASEVDDEEFSKVIRENPEVVTGVEKGEDEELHFKNLVERQHNMIERNEVNDDVPGKDDEPAIPCPEIGGDAGDIEKEPFFDPNYKHPKSYIKFSLPVEECIGCLYCLDEVDENWLQEHNSKKNSKPLEANTLERIMDFFEKVAKRRPLMLAERKLPSWEDCLKQLPEKLLPWVEDVEIVYTHWKARRNQNIIHYQKVSQLMPEIKVGGNWLTTVAPINKPKNNKIDKNDKKKKTVEAKKDDDDDAYVCFRRRELRPVRRTRRTEAQSVNKLKNIRVDLQSGRDLLGSVQSREKVKKQKIGIDRKVFTLECQVKDLQRELGIKKHPQKIKKQKPFTSQYEIVGLRKNPVKASKKDTDLSLTDITDASILFIDINEFVKTSSYPSAFRSRFGRGGRRRYTLDRSETTKFRVSREIENWRFKYDTDEEEDICSDEDYYTDDEETVDADEEMKDKEISDNPIIWKILTDEDYQNLSTYRKHSKEKQNSPKQPTREEFINAKINTLSQGNTDIRSNSDNRSSGQASQSRPNSEAVQNTEHRVENQVPRINNDSRNNIDIDVQRPSNFLPRVNNIDLRTIEQRPSVNIRTVNDPRTNSTQRNVESRLNTNIDPQAAFVDPRSFNNANVQRDQPQIIMRDQRTNNPSISTQMTSRSQNLTADPNSIRETLLNSVPFSGNHRSTADQNLNGVSRLNGESQQRSLGHNGHAVRSPVSTNHRDNLSPYRRNSQRNNRIPENSTNSGSTFTFTNIGNRIGTNLRGTLATSVGTPNMTASTIPLSNQGGAIITVPVIPISAQIPSRRPSVNIPSNAAQINGDGISQTVVSPNNVIFTSNGQVVTPINTTRTGSNPGMIINSTGQVVGPITTVSLGRSDSNPGVVLNNAGQIVSPMNNSSLTRSGSSSGGAINNAGQVVTTMNNTVLVNASLTRSGSNPGAIDPRRLQRTNQGMLINNNNLIIANMSRNPSNQGTIMNGVAMVDPNAAQHSQTTSGIMLHGNNQMIDPTKMNIVQIGGRMVILDNQNSYVNGGQVQSSTFLNGATQVQQTSSPSTFVNSHSSHPSPLPTNTPNTPNTPRSNMGTPNSRGEKFSTPQDPNSPAQMSLVQRQILLMLAHVTNGSQQAFVHPGNVNNMVRSNGSLSPYIRIGNFTQDELKLFGMNMNNVQQTNSSSTPMIRHSSIGVNPSPNMVNRSNPAVRQTTNVQPTVQSNAGIRHNFILPGAVNMIQTNSPNRQIILPANNNQQRPSPNVINNTNSPSMNNVQIRQNQTNTAFLHANNAQIQTTIATNNDK
ncbi:8078_t:CDS:10 [Diversispora eburnea]|uniref:Enhancer of polycomb-like protein n=1 Tax=Diversispora eburnea TaxID=1213867 RepID=A0A9N8W8Z0_9GLOM|nr:8078_t:CDS:10 [Diversispora eburnea]